MLSRLKLLQQTELYLVKLCSTAQMENQLK